MNQTAIKSEKPSAAAKGIPPTEAPAQAQQHPEIRYADNATFEKAAKKVFKVHGELLRKLAQ